MNQHAFTLVETIVVISMTTLIMVTLGMLLTYFYKTSAYTLQQSVATAQARQGIEDATHYLREASYASDGSYPIAQVATSSITFYANTNGGSTIQRVAYTLEGSTLYRTITEPTGNPFTYIGGPSATTTVAISVVNDSLTPVFRYFDNTGTELTAPVNVSKISFVETTLVIDVDANRAPVSYTLSGGATLRNLKDQL